MKLKTKKLIAREIILLISCSLLSLFLFVCVYPYNWIFESKSGKLQEKINLKNIEKNNLDRIINFLAYTPPLPIDYLSNDLETVGNACGGLGEEAIGKTSAWCEKRRKEIQDQKHNDYLYIKNLLENQNNGGSYTRNTYNTSSIFDRLAKLKAEIDSLEYTRSNNFNKIIDSKEQLNFGFLSFKIFLIILYPLRFLILVSKWAFKTIRQNE